MPQGKLCRKAVGAVHIAAQAVKNCKSRRNVPAFPYICGLAAAVAIDTHDDKTFSAWADSPLPDAAVRLLQAGAAR